MKAIQPNYDMAFNFLSKFDPKAEHNTFQTFDDKKTKDPKKAKVLHGPFEEHADELMYLLARV